MKFLDVLGTRPLVFDGAMGTMLQSRGLETGAGSESWNTTHANAVEAVHIEYLNAGCDLIKTNTFGANAIKCPNCQEATRAGVAIARSAAKKANPNALIALNIGPTGKLIRPFGDTDFEDVVASFAEQIAAGADADCVLIETFTDIIEAKAAIIAAKENCDLPIIITLSLDKDGRLLTGGDIACAVVTLEALGVSALGLNCGLGPIEMEKLMPQLVAASSTPIVLNPNAGLPRLDGEKTVYDMEPAQFSQVAARLVAAGAAAVGGCCGTTPEHIKAVARAVKGLPVVPVEKKSRCLVSSYSKVVEIGARPLIIGERLNPTGKPKLKKALLNGDMDYMLNEAVSQVESGADILDVNVGIAGIDEAEVMPKVLQAVESVTDAPLQIDTSDAKALERALRVYAGKPLVNSVNGKPESLETVLPLVKKYGAAVVALALDENGIPEEAEGRVEIARRIADKAQEYGIAREDIIVDTLTMAVSASDKGAAATLEALDVVKRELGLKTVLGVSNVSFGLPDRPRMNAAFFAMALAKGLDCGIINPMSEQMMDAYVSSLALLGYDRAFEGYIARFTGRKENKAQAPSRMTLHEAIVKGLKQPARDMVRELLENSDAISIIDNHLAPALDEIGRAFESGQAFLPQLLMSAEAASAGFDVIREKLAQTGMKSQTLGKIVLATVEGDVHDIGKNIVCALLENYGFTVIDLGKDVPADRVVEMAVSENAPIVGLSALMTTTVASMKRTIELLREAGDFKIMVGGAVLNEQYADMIGADFYAKDAMQAVRQALKWVGH